MMRVCYYKKKRRYQSFLSAMCGFKRTAVCKPAKEPIQITSGALVLDAPAQRIMKNRCQSLETKVFCYSSLS